MYIGDSVNNRLRKVTVSTGIITTIAGSSTSGSFSGDGGAATSATMDFPDGIALDSSGLQILLSFFWNTVLNLAFSKRQRVRR